MHFGSLKLIFNLKFSVYHHNRIISPDTQLLEIAVVFLPVKFTCKDLTHTLSTHAHHYVTSRAAAGSLAVAEGGVQATVVPAWVQKGQADRQTD